MWFLKHGWHTMRNMKPDKKQSCCSQVEKGQFQNLADLSGSSLSAGNRTDIKASDSSSHTAKRKERHTNRGALSDHHQEQSGLPRDEPDKQAPAGPNSWEVGWRRRNNLRRDENRSEPSSSAKDPHHYVPHASSGRTAHRGSGGFPGVFELADEL